LEELKVEQFYEKLRRDKSYCLRHKARTNKSTMQKYCRIIDQMDEDDLKTFEDTIFLAETGLSIPNSDFDDDDDEYLYTYSLLGVASPLSLYL